MRITVLLGLALLLDGCGSVKGPFSNTDNSPIVVADGSSIHFRQLSAWQVTDSNNIAVDKANYHATGYYVKLCPKSEDFDGAGNYCIPRQTQTPFQTTNWVFFLCSASPCNSSTAIAALKQDATIAQVDAANVSAPGGFTTEARATDGDSRKLSGVNVNLDYWSLSDGRGSKSDQPCHDTSGSANPQRCVLKILYCKNGITCL